MNVVDYELFKVKDIWGIVGEYLDVDWDYVDVEQDSNEFPKITNLPLLCDINKFITKKIDYSFACRVNKDTINALENIKTYVRRRYAEKDILVYVYQACAGQGYPIYSIEISFRQGNRMNIIVFVEDYDERIYLIFR